MHDLLYTIRTWTRKAACSAVRPLVRFDPEENLMVFSDPRGGSTWLAEMLLRVPGTALLWEPLNTAFVTYFDDLDFSLRQHIPSDATWKAARTRFESLLRGELIGHWTAHLPFRLLRAERMVVKICRGNALLPWLTDAFDFTYAPVHLVRHPFAVVASQLRHGAWDGFERQVLVGGPFDGYYRAHEAYLRSLETKCERLTAQWCLTNKVPLRSNGDRRAWVTVFYEDLLLNTEHELERIFGRWGIPIPDGIMRSARRASRTTNEAGVGVDDRRQLSKWTSYLSGEQVADMLAVLEHFDIRVYGRDLMPDRSALATV